MIQGNIRNIFLLFNRVQIYYLDGSNGNLEEWKSVC